MTITVAVFNVALYEHIHCSTYAHFLSLIVTFDREVGIDELSDFLSYAISSVWTTLQTGQEKITNDQLA